MTWSVVEVAEQRTVLIEAPDEAPAELAVTGPSVVLELSETGLQGPPGPVGPGGGSLFVYDRMGVPAATWTIVHNLGRAVHATVLDDDGVEVTTDITHTPDLNTLIATFAEPRSGTAIVS
jgi:hypothetical protein